MIDSKKNRASFLRCAKFSNIKVVFLDSTLYSKAFLDKFGPKSKNQSVLVMTSMLRGCASYIQENEGDDNRR